MSPLAIASTLFGLFQSSGSGSTAQSNQTGSGRHNAAESGDFSSSLALRMADRLSSLPGKFDGAMLAQWTRAQFLLHWHEGCYFRLLNRMLFHAAAPEERYRIFQHFYRLASDLIGRFYAGRLTPRDKLRILTGRPPVSVVKAVGVLLGRGAAR